MPTANPKSQVYVYYLAFSLMPASVKVPDGEMDPEPVRALVSCFLQQKELMEAGRKQLEQLVQMNLLQQAHLGQPEVGKALLEQLQSSQDNYSHSHVRNVSTRSVFTAPCSVRNRACRGGQYSL